MRSRARKEKLVKILPPQDPKARDEGPRLIPLDGPQDQLSSSSRMDYYLALADKMLGRKNQP